MDSSAITILATQAVAILTPYLAKATETIVPRFAEDIYNLVKTHFENKVSAKETLTDFEKSPEDADVQAAVRLQLKKSLAQDEPFAAKLDELVKNSTESPSQPSVHADRRGVAAGGYISGNVITGDVHGTLSIGGIQEEGQSKP